MQCSIVFPLVTRINKMMDYKYIEQLIDRYFEGETTLEEEQILRKFFAQEGLPEHLQKWQALFAAERDLSAAHLDDTFHERILALTGEYHVTAQPISLHVRLRPLYRVAAFLSFAVVIGSAVEFSTGSRTESTQEQVAVQEQDELDVDEAKPLDIRSAELMTSDTLHIQ